jgi:hypothetical protein
MACEHCSTGPDGLEGHSELTLYLDGQPRYGQANGQHVFMCLLCTAKWSRYYEGGGLFRWSPGEGD